MMSVYINEVTLSQSVCRHQLKLFVIITVFFFFVLSYVAKRVVKANTVNSTNIQ